jgi:NitT/TauT family transport system ATP-binding protein
MIGQAMALIEAKDLTKSFNERRVLAPLSFQIEEQEFVCILGPSGCGKSTLLKLLAGLEAPTSGSLVMSNEALFARSLVFQDATLLNWRTALENVLLPLEISKIFSAEEARTRSKAELTALGLEDSLNSFPRALSGGMKMRTAIARSLVQNPKLLLMDEPFSALDEYTRFQLQEKMRLLFTEARNKMTVIFVTHSLGEAIFLADRIFVLSSDGALLSVEKVDLPNSRVANLRSKTGFFTELQRLQNLVNS